MNDKTYRDREILAEAQAKGKAATLGAFLRLSGPGWLQSAITLGGGSLGSALYLGMLGGTSLLWVQLLAIFLGVVMLSAISYVTLSTGKRPYAAINEYVNPVLGVAWITATVLANMIFILAQFSLCYDALDNNVVPGGLGDGFGSKLMVTLAIGAIALTLVLMSFRPGMASRIFDGLLKAIIGFVVICFLGAVVVLINSGQMNFGEVFYGMIPNLSSWLSLSPQLAALSEGLSPEVAGYWAEEVGLNRRSSIISAVAAAVGINMTFLLPYSMLDRGWGRTFRGLAVWDLMTGMAIPFVLVTSCIVITSAHAFHGKADEQILDSDPEVIQQSSFFDGFASSVAARIRKLDPDSRAAQRLREIAEMASDAESPEEAAEQKRSRAEARKAVVANYAANQMSENERKLALATVKPSSKLLALSLRPLLGEWSDLVFGMGAFAMGFSTIIILMLINGYCLAEMAGQNESTILRTTGATAALAAGISWVWLWAGASKTYLLIVAGTFAVILLPIAYFAFFLMLNSTALMGEDKPTGGKLVAWNIMMSLGVAGAVAAAYVSILDRASDPLNAGLIIGGVATFLLLMLVGFSARPPVSSEGFE